jgi:hypothetical protein
MEVEQIGTMHSSSAATRRETLEYLAAMVAELRGMALDVGCLTLGALLQVAAQEARLQLAVRLAGNTRPAETHMQEG